MRIVIFLAILFLSLDIYSNTTPKIYNFRVENSNKNRVYFDVDGDISGLTKQGFVISGKIISSINTSGNYFVVSKPFTFWDNNTIRLGENSDISDANPKMHNFTLEYIVNNITEPSTSKEIFVNANVSSSGDGSSELKAYKTLTEAVASMPSGGGVKIWVKAGLYNNENFNLNGLNGKINNPNILEGYKNTPGDLNQIQYYEYKPNQKQDKLDPSEMPLFDGGNRGSNTFWDLKNDSYNIFKNIQVTNYKRGFRSASMNGFLAENIIIKDIGGLKSNDGVAFLFQSSTNNSNFIKIINSLVINSTMEAYFISGNNNLLLNNKAFCNEAPEGAGDINATTDYYYAIHGSNNIIINSLAYKDTPNGNGHLGHGFSIKGVGGPTEYNLVDSCTAIGIWGAFQARWSTSKFNVFKNSESHAAIPNRRNSYVGSGGIEIFAGAESNIFENLYIHDVDAMINWQDNSEGKSNTIGVNNIIRNCIGDNLKAVLRGSNVNVTTSVPTGNKIYNNTINKANYLFDIVNNKINFKNNQFKNNNFINIKLRDRPSASKSSGWSYEYNNFYKSFDTPQGTNNISVDPKLDKSFKPTELTPISVIYGGKDLIEVKYDKDGVERVNGKHSIGAFQKKSNSTGSIKTNAGSDQTICQGESVTLTASGGSSYSWNTGNTTKSITVSPDTTTTYTVTVTEGGESDSDSVEVIVNNVTANAGSNKTINEGENTTLTASGGGTYLWNTGATSKSITVNPNTTTTYSVTVTNNGCEDTDEVIVTVNQNNSSGVNANAGSDQTICQGESVTLTASGGSTYSWNTGATSKSITVSPNTTTTYIVTVTEGSESDSDSVEVTVNNVTANAGSDKTINEGENITLTASGGGTYLWNTGATTQSINVSPNTTTTYSVTVTNNGCEDTDEVIVTVNQNNNSGVNANAGPDQTICQGESLTLTASGGSSYSWNTGATTKSITVSPNTTTIYTVNVTEENESDSDSVEVIVNSVTANAGSNKTMNEGENITLIASGGGTYLWDTGAKTQSITVSPQETRNYSVTVYKNNCQDTDVVQVTVIENDTSPPLAKADAGEDVTICLGESVKLNATGGSTYLWSTGETSKTINVNPTRTTTYTLTATRGGVTNFDTVIITVENCSILSEGIKQDEFKVYPNPTNGNLNIKASNSYSSLNLNIYSINGSIVYSDKIQMNNNVAFKTLDLSNLTKGVYIVRMFNSDYYKTKKILLY